MKSVSRLGGLALAAAFALPWMAAATMPTAIEIIADKDNRFKIPGEKKPVITAHPKEVLRLKVIARKGSEWTKDGTVHSITIKELKDQGWDLQLKEGTQEFVVVAPSAPGSYTIECAVKCGKGHDDMRMTLVVQ